MKQNFALETIEVRMDDNPVAALKTLMAKGIRFVITDRPAADVLQLADAAVPHGGTIFNAGAHDALREDGFWPRSGILSPQPGFLHQRTVLDTLGTDQPEPKCKLTTAQ
jgi:hypothetical protein